tara:strand:- start:1451 stop:1690 length:240 start_codon:yes stop_codon:yes gene_type:complete
MKYYEFTAEKARELEPTDIRVACQKGDTNYIIETEATLTGSIQEFANWEEAYTWGNSNGYKIEKDENTWNYYIPEISYL